MPRVSLTRQRRGAVTIAMIKTITSALDVTIALHRIICGAVLLGFFFYLRGSEFLSTNSRRILFSSIRLNSARRSRTRDRALSAIIDGSPRAQT